MAHELFNDRDRSGDRDSKSHSFYRVSADLTGVDADHIAVDVYKRAAGIAGVDRRIGLNKCAGDGIIVDLSVVGTDDSCCDRLSIAKCVADRNNILTDLEAVRTAKCRHFDLIPGRILDIGKGNSDHCQIVAGVCPFDLRVTGLLVDEQHSEMIRPFHYVIVGHDKKLVVSLSDDNA